ncbi:MAG: PleD family two-component system response regulator [Candidatus Methylomirabilales bacterium]
MADEHPEKKTTVLLVDDHPFFLRYLSHFFNRKEYEVATAANGQEAVEHARRLRPKLILLDLEMPDINGVETCKMLRADETTREIPIIILTAAESLELNHIAFEAGAQATVLKSMSRERLMNIVEVVLQTKKVADPTVLPEA